jgi:DNA-binding MurR/RpiR family transcriptional regulator
LNDAAELLREAPRVWFLGLGLEEGLARYGRLLLSRLRHEVLQLGLSNGAWAEELAMTGPHDALVLITLRPRPRILRPILEYAKTTRMTVVTITDKMSALPAQRYSSVVLACHVTSYGFGPSHTAIASVLRLLAVVYATRVGEPATQRADIIADIHEELDDTE